MPKGDDVFSAVIFHPCRFADTATDGERLGVFLECVRTYAQHLARLFHVVSPRR